MSQVAVPRHALALSLGLSACVDEDETITVPPTQDEDAVAGEQEPGVPVDPPGENVPGKGDGSATSSRRQRLRFGVV